MVLSHQHKFIFLCNGKTGTTSLERALGDYDESSDFDCGAYGLWVKRHIPPAVLKAFLPDEIWNAYFKFVFVRHPQDWFVSQYKHNFRQPRFPTKRLIRYPGRLVSSLRDYSRAKREASKEVFDANDVDFLFEHLKRYRGMPGASGLFQSSWAYDSNQELVVDFIGKFESLDADTEVIKERIGIDFNLGHLNKTKHRPFLECLTPDAAERIGELWEIDFDNFGYKIERGLGSK